MAWSIQARLPEELLQAALVTTYPRNPESCVLCNTSVVTPILLHAIPVEMEPGRPHANLRARDATVLIPPDLWQGIHEEMLLPLVLQ